MGTQNDLEVLTPTPVIWNIGDKTFTQKPLALENLGRVLEVVVDELIATDSLDLLTGAAENSAPGDTLKIGLKMVTKLPKALPKVAAVVLNAEADEDHIRKHLSARQALGIVRAFVAQNDVSDLVQDFLAIVQEFQTPPTAPTNGLHQPGA